MAMKFRSAMAWLVLPVATFSSLGCGKSAPVAVAPTALPVLPVKKGPLQKVRVLIPNPGPPRVLPMVWKQVPLDEDADLRGYDFAVKTDMKLVPRTNLPPGVGSSGALFPKLELLQLQVKRGGKWTFPDMSKARNRHLVSTSRGSSTLDASNLGSMSRENLELLRDSLRETTLQLQVGDDFGDAQEMRLKCRMLGSFRYSGRWLRGVAMPKTVHRDVLGQPYEDLITPPFVLAVKAPFRSKRLNLAALQHSTKASPVKVIEARLFHFHFLDQLQLWVKSTPQTLRAKYVVWGVKITDAKGKTVPIIDRYGNSYPLESGLWWQMGQRELRQRVSLGAGYQIGANEVVLSWALGDKGPRGGWDNLKWPLRLTAKVSDGVSKPVNFSGLLRDVEEFEPPLASQTPQPPVLAFWPSVGVG
jgi:hypothetical protein